MAKSQRIFSRAVERELLQHPGEWVTLDGGRIIAFGPDPKTVLAAAEAAGVKTPPLLYRVPDPDTLYIYGTSLLPSVAS